MTRPLVLLAAAALVAACETSVPDSNPQGVGFSDYDNYSQSRNAAREAELSGPSATNLPPRTIGDETLAVLNATSTGGGVATTDAPLDARSPAVVANNPGISDEQDFSAVSSRESIESDAERLARQRAAYTVIQPEALPTRDGPSRPNVVAFALATTNQPGEQIYQRSGFNRDGRFARVCAGYPSPDRAQEAFLADGGPERDRKGMDPDGDGFACYWDPRPYRAARAAAN